MNIANVLLDVLKDFRVFFNPKTQFGRKRLGGFALLVLVIVLGFKFFGANDATDTPIVSTTTEVSVLSIGELSTDAKFDTIGRVEAVSEANLQAEASGRVTAVQVEVGQSIGAGTVLATIEGNAERAAVVQAQGAYEAALAASAQSGVGLSESKTVLNSALNGAVSSCRASYNTANSIVRNSIDPFFGSPNATIPGLKIDGGGMTTKLNNERVAFQTILTDWQGRSSTISINSNLETEIAYAKNQTERTIALVDAFITLFAQPGGSGGFTEAELQNFSTDFTALRTTLINTRASLDASLSAIASANDSIRRAQLAASGGTVSASDAQVKIALGSLQAAQAAYQKTIIRTPIQGVVNAFYLKAGDYTTLGQPAGIVANNEGLQIKTFVNEIDSANISVGDTVVIEGGATGVITAKAAALDPTNGKVAVVVGVNKDSELTNGATVKITFSQVTAEKTDERTIIPLSALKITADGAFVFIVNDEMKLVAVPVTQGQLLGEAIEITSGVTKSTRIVTDARGLKDGQLITIKN
ncbi:MAG: biotin/lipoyl-binding protein [Patescibacteria group bacterium]